MCIAQFQNNKKQFNFQKKGLTGENHPQRAAKRRSIITQLTGQVAPQDQVQGIQGRRGQ